MVSNEFMLELVTKKNRYQQRTSTWKFTFRQRRPPKYSQMYVNDAK